MAAFMVRSSWNSTVPICKQINTAHENQVAITIVGKENEAHAPCGRTPCAHYRRLPLQHDCMHPEP